jgi:predicted dehydrogenase
MAMNGHGPSLQRYAQQHPQVELAACCDIDVAKATEFAAKFGFARHYTDTVKMLDQERPHAACLVVPVERTCEMGCEILRRHIALLTEKPPGQNVEELEQLIAAADADGTPTMVAFNRRHMPLLKRLRKEVSRFGRRDFVGYEFLRVNRRDPDFSSTAIHGIDAVRYVAASDYAEVNFVYEELPQLGQGVANILMQCRMASGTLAQLNFCPVCGILAERATVHVQDHSFFLRGGCGVGPDFPGLLRHFESGKLVGQVSGPEMAGSGEMFMLEGFYGENAAFLDDLLAGKKPVDDLASARQSLIIAQAMSQRQSSVRF